VVFLLIAVRQVGRFNLRIWQVMLGGALAVLVFGQIAPADALHAINPDVMLFLFGMFVVGEGLVQSGDLATIAHRLFFRAADAHQVVLLILFGLGTLSAILMNDTLAIIGTPLVLALAARHHMPPKLLLLTLAFAITTGSVMSPMGNPQNLLVAMGAGMPSPFVTFGLYLLLPTMISLFAAYGVLRFFYRDAFTQEVPFQERTLPEHGSRLSFPVLCSLALIFVLTTVRIAASLAGIALPISLPVIALAAAAPILLLSEKRVAVLRGIDWATLVFFAAMFVLMQSVWDSGVFLLLISPDTVAGVPVIMALAVVVSQFISNVPFVALFQPMILEAG
jgi:Na+/H+ antiporter NhaD/arsenite permease-like protein